jgi:hypothetical protein
MLFTRFNFYYNTINIIFKFLTITSPKKNNHVNEKRGSVLEAKRLYLHSMSNVNNRGSLRKIILLVRKLSNLWKKGELRGSHMQKYNNITYQQHMA